MYCCFLFLSVHLLPPYSARRGRMLQRYTFKVSPSPSRPAFWHTTTSCCIRFQKWRMHIICVDIYIYIVSYCIVFMHGCKCKRSNLSEIRTTHEASTRLPMVCFLSRLEMWTLLVEGRATASLSRSLLWCIQTRLSEMSHSVNYVSLFSFPKVKMQSDVTSHHVWKHPLCRIIVFLYVFAVNFLEIKKATCRFHLELHGFTGACWQTSETAAGIAPRRCAQSGNISSACASLLCTLGFKNTIDTYWCTVLETTPLLRMQN